MVLFDVGYFKLAARAQSVAAQAYFLSRLHQHTTRLEAVGGRGPGVEVARGLQTEPRPRLEKAVFLGARERGAARLSAARMPAAVVNARRRRAGQGATNRGYPPSQAPRTL